MILRMIRVMARPISGSARGGPMATRTVSLGVFVLVGVLDLAVAVGMVVHGRHGARVPPDDRSLPRLDGRRWRARTKLDIFMIVKASNQSVVVPLDRCEVACVDPERVAAVAERLPDERESQRLAETFRVLSDPGRVRLIVALLEGELCVCDLAAVTALSETACSHNLRLLRSARLVRYRKQGRNVYYALDDAHIRQLLDVGLQHLAHEDGERG